MIKLSGKRPTILGPKGGKLSRCGWKPNCVCSSHEEDSEHFIAPIDLGRPVDSRWNDLVQIIKELKAAKIIQQDSFYLYAEFSTPLLGFVDDVEFLGKAGSPILEVRSSSRLGVRDFGVNRKRIEEIRLKLGERA